MNRLPLGLRLKREAHKKIADAQDLIVVEVYKKFNKAILHGGTGIWRCYSGLRFSDDLDFYLPRDNKKIEELFLDLKRKGFEIIKKKIGDRSVYSELKINRTSVQLEATFQEAKGVLADYEMSDGNLLSIFSLTPKNFIIEKIDTYLKRFKIRDLWDVFFLSRIAPPDEKLTESINQLIEHYKPPIDENDINSIIFEGIIPSSEEMITYIKRKFEVNKNG